jgi:DNA-binding phage protein
MTSKHRSSNAADHPDQPKVIASFLNEALATGDTVAFVKAIGDLI